MSRVWPAACVGLLLAACASAPSSAPRRLALPARAPDALAGTRVYERLRGLELPARERLVAQQLAVGNVPDFLRDMVPVAVEATIAGERHTARFWCTPDHLGLGVDGDWFRMPMTPTLAQRVADVADCVLPTRAMVDAIWRAATVRLEPIALSPKEHDIVGIDVFWLHHRQLEAHLAASTPGELVAGDKKDVVVSALLAEWPGRVCIYGWHRRDGRPIQPLWKGHTFAHVDYSHGIRLVAREMEVDGRVTTVDAVLADPELCALLSDEGAFTCWRYPTF